MLTLAIPQFVVGLLVVLFVVVSVMLMLIVLIQRPQGGGLSEAFGSSSGSNTSAFGAKTGDALTTATIVIFLLFLGFAIGLNYMVRPPKPTPLTPAQAQGPPGAAEPGVSATTIDPTTGEPAAPVQLERLDGPPPGYVPDAATYTIPTPTTTPTTTTPSITPNPTPAPAPTEPPAQPTPPTTPPPTPPTPQPEPKPQ